MWGAQEKSEGAHQKNSAGASRRHCAPHLQIASDTTGQIYGDRFRGVESAWTVRICHFCLFLSVAVNPGLRCPATCESGWIFWSNNNNSPDVHYSD